MSKKHHRVEAIRKFIVSNTSIIHSSPFNKAEFKKIKEAYFGNLLHYQFGIPKDHEICDTLINLLIKREKICTLESLHERLRAIPFIQNLNPHLDIYKVTVEQAKQDVSLSTLPSDLEKIDILRREYVENKISELDEEVSEHKARVYDQLLTLKEELKRYPSVLDDTDYEEPTEQPIINESLEWWQELNLRSNPFPGPLEGFHMIDKSLYDAIAIETAPIKWMLGKINAGTFDFFHKGYLVSGEFGSGKTTFIDFISPHLATCHIETIILPQIENISVPHYVGAFQKQLSFKICQLAKKYGIPTTDRIVDFIEAELIMLDLQANHNVKGFLLFIDDLHKHTQQNLVFQFLANLQMVKSNLSREGINVSFFVSGLPGWRDRIRQDTALTGFLDASESLQLSEVTPDIAAQAIQMRLRAFSSNPDRDIKVHEDFFKSIFRRTVVERGGIKIGFRPYIQEAQSMLSAKKFDILAIDFTTLDATSLEQIRTQLESSNEFKECINKLIFGGKIEKQAIRTLTLKILCEILVRKGVTEDDEIFSDNKFSFKRLVESGFIRRFKRKERPVWRISPFLDDLNRKILDERGLSIEDYLVQIYSPVTGVTRKPDTTKQSECKYNQHIKDLSSYVDKNIADSLTKALRTHDELIKPYIVNKSASLPSLSTDNLNSIDNCIWSLMKCILRFESPSLIDIYGEDNPLGWRLRHRALEGPQQFLNLQANPTTKVDIARRITFANEAFDELWLEFRRAFDISRNSNVKAFQLPMKALTCFYEEHDKLFAFTKGEEYFSSFGRVVQCLEECIRNYLHVSCLLLFGPYHSRRSFLPPDIRKYISAQVPPSTAYEAYNEFENMNRGQYRSLFTSIDKKGPFYRFIVYPLISTWDAQDLNAFFALFGDMNIISSHIKKMQVEEIKRDIPTFFRLSCRLLSAMSARIFSIVTFENTISSENNSTTVVFGSRHKNTDTLNPVFSTPILSAMPMELYHHDISKPIEDGFLDKIVQVSDNSLGESFMDPLNIDEVRVKYGMEHTEAVSCVAYLIATGKLRGIGMYGATLYLRKLKTVEKEHGASV